MTPRPKILLTYWIQFRQAVKETAFRMTEAEKEESPFCKAFLWLEAQSALQRRWISQTLTKVNNIDWQRGMLSLLVNNSHNFILKFKAESCSFSNLSGISAEFFKIE